MTLLQIVQTIPPDSAKLIDEILSYSSEAAERMGLSDDKYSSYGPPGWNKNELLSMSPPMLEAQLIYLRNNNCRKASYFTDFSGELKEL